MTIDYRGSDGRMHFLGDDNSLKHYKYIKKIMTGSGPRYFYSQDELRAFYEEAKGNAKGELNNLKKKSEETWRYAKPQSPAQMQKRVNSDIRREQSRHSNRYEKLDAKRWKMIRDPNRPDNLAKDKKFQRNEDKIVTENRRHEYENRRNNSRKSTADRYAKAVNTAKEKWDYGRPQKPSTMRRKVARDSAKEFDRYRKERDRIHREDLKVFDDEKRSKNMSAKEHRKLRERIRKNNEDWYKNYDTHDERSRVNSDRRYNANRYQNAVDEPKKAAEKANKKRKKVSKAASNSLNRVRSESSNKIERGRSSVEKRIKKAKRTAKNEANGAKRVTKAIKGKGGIIYSGDGKTYSKYYKKKGAKNVTISKKKKKTGKVERGILKAYRKTHPYE